jgi:type IV secretion system protein VirD4
LVGQVTLVLAIAVFGAACATQYTAVALGFQPQLGAPWMVAFGAPIYRLVEPTR